MKTMLKAFGIIALIAVISFAVSCGGGGGGGGGGDPKNPDPKTPESEPESMIEMVAIPAGSFYMGSPVGEFNRSTSEKQHEVTLTEGFNMGRYPVTQEQYEKVMGITIEEQAVLAGGLLYGTGKNYPMYYVNWYEAVVFCNKLSVMEDLIPAYSIDGEADTDEWETVCGEPLPLSFVAASKWNEVVIVPDSDGYRLPTEAQWEYACRGGEAGTAATNPFGIGDGTKITEDMANFNWENPYDINHVPAGGEYNDPLGTASTGTTSVGYYGSGYANSYGLYDMHGNVNEWCWDWYGLYPGGVETDPEGAPTGSNRVLHGGAWYFGGGNLRSAYRAFNDPSYRGLYGLGFRVLRP